MVKFVSELHLSLKLQPCEVGGFDRFGGHFRIFATPPLNFCYTPMIFEGFFFPLTSILIRWRWNFQKSKYSWDEHFLKIWNKSENSKSGFDHFFVCSKNFVYEDMKEGKGGENDYELEVEKSAERWKNLMLLFFIILF